jgi:hypothetical protein
LWCVCSESTDSIAISDGIWWISERYTTGHELPLLPSVPIEEATFFVVSRAFHLGIGSMLTEIYLCEACSCHEILRIHGNAPDR